MTFRTWFLLAMITVAIIGTVMWWIPTAFAGELGRWEQLIATVIILLSLIVTLAQAVSTALDEMLQRDSADAE